MMLSANPPQWYGLVAAGLVLFWLGVRVVTRLLRMLVSCLCFIFLKYVLYRAIWRRARWDTSWFHLILFSIYIGTNVFCICFQAGDREQIASRAGILATINLLPLLVGRPFSAVTDILGVSLGLSLRDISTMHVVFSVMSIIQSVVHVVINAGLHRLKFTAEQIFGIAVGRDDYHFHNH